MDMCKAVQAELSVHGHSLMNEIISLCKDLLLNYSLKCLFGCVKRKKERAHCSSRNFVFALI